jgi:hypothetical protein
MVAHAWHIACLYVLITQLDRAMPIVGPVFYLCYSMPINLPYVGRAYAFLVNGPIFRLQMPFKLLAWTLSASGGILGYLIYVRLFGIPNNRGLWYCLLIASLTLVLRTSHSILLFQHFDAEGFMAAGGKFMQKLHLRGLNDLAVEDRKKLVKSIARSTFVDTFVNSFLQLLSGCGLAFFALGQLHLIQTMHDQPVTLWNSLVSSFSLASFGAGVETFTGERWRIIRISVQLLIFIWSVLYVALAPSSLNDEGVWLIAEKTMFDPVVKLPLVTTVSEPEESPVTLALVPVARNERSVPNGESVINGDGAVSANASAMGKN